MHRPRWKPVKLSVMIFCALVASVVVPGTVAHGETQTWTDLTGKHTVEAEFVKLEDGQVTLRREDGKEVTLPLGRLSTADRARAERLAEATTTPAHSDKEAVEDTAEAFFKSLQNESREDARELLTEAARRKMDSGQSPVRELPSPDRGVNLRTGEVAIEGDTATAQVTVRLRGRYQKTLLHLRQEAERWLVFAISAPGPSGDVMTISFEGEGGTPATDAPTSTGGSQVAGTGFNVPDGDPAELLGFIENTLQNGLKGVRTQEEIQERGRLMFAAVLEASEKTLTADATEAQKKSAAQYKLQALQVLGQLGMPGMDERLAGFAGELDALGLASLRPLVEATILKHELSNLAGKTRSDAMQLVIQARELLGKTEVGIEQAQLAQTAAQVAEMIDDKFAAEVNEELGSLLASNQHETIAALGESMLGTARRLGLLGNEMQLTGLQLDGTSFDLSQYDGKVVLVDFWATWCGPCMAEMPNIRRNYEQYHDKGFEVVAVSVDRDLDALKEYVAKESPPWTILADYHPDLSDDQRMSGYYGITGIPTTILVGSDGKVVSLSARGEALGRELKRLLGPAG